MNGIPAHQIDKDLDLASPIRDANCQVLHGYVTGVNQIPWSLASTDA